MPVFVRVCVACVLAYFFAFIYRYLFDKFNI